VPVAVIGPREATTQQLCARFWRTASDCRLAVICGGRGGTMPVIGLEGGADLGAKAAALKSNVRLVVISTLSRRF